MGRVLQWSIDNGYIRLDDWEMAANNPGGGMRTCGMRSIRKILAN